MWPSLLGDCALRYRSIPLVNIGAPVRGPRPLNLVSRDWRRRKLRPEYPLCWNIAPPQADGTLQRGQPLLLCCGSAGCFHQTSWAPLNCITCVNADLLDEGIADTFVSIGHKQQRPAAARQTFGVVRSPRRAAIVTNSGSESAFIFRITWPLWALTVISLMPSSPPTCLFNSPETTSAITSRSR